MQKKIAVIGAGIFGCTVAKAISKKGYKCTIYEQNKEILCGASKVNQYRLHRGYHYPRSDATCDLLKISRKMFQEEYKEAICNDYKHIYSLARNDSKVKKSEFIDFMNRNDLKYKILDRHPLIKERNSSLILEVDESLINYEKIALIIKNELRNNVNIDLKLNTPFLKELSSNYDYIINCTYGLSNDYLPNELKRDYKFQLVEKIVVKPSLELRNQSIVVIDGPFMCIDPISGTNKSVLGNVLLAIHNTSYGFSPKESPDYMKPWQIIKDKKCSRFDEFVKHGGRFIKGYEKCTFLYSMTGYRVTLPNKESTDDRLTNIRSSGKYIDIFSGKFDACSWSAKRVLDYIG